MAADYRLSTVYYKTVNTFSVHTLIRVAFTVLSQVNTTGKAFDQLLYY